MKKIRIIIAAVVAPLFRDAVGIAGVGAISYGAWLVYRPAGIMLAGGFAVAASVILSLRAD